MKFILMDYVNETGWPTLTKNEKEHWLGAYMAYVEDERGRSEEQPWPEAHLDGNDRAGREWKDPGAGRPLRRLERAVGRVSYHRSGRSRCCVFEGGT